MKKMMMTALFAAMVAVAFALNAGKTGCGPLELGAKVAPPRTSRHTIADRTAANLAKKPKLKGIAASAGGKLRILVFKNERSVEVQAPGWKAPRIYPMTTISRLERTGLASTDTLFKVLFALNRLDAIEDMLKEQLRLVKFPKTLDGDFESAPKVVKRVRHKGGTK